MTKEVTLRVTGFNPSDRYLEEGANKYPLQNVNHLFKYNYKVYTVPDSFDLKEGLITIFSLYFAGSAENKDGTIKAVFHTGPKKVYKKVL